MATPASPETIEIRRRGRRRLVGAVVIVALLVVFVPMLLDSEPWRAANGPAMQIPPTKDAPALPAPAPSKTVTPELPAPKPADVPRVTAGAASKAGKDAKAAPAASSAQPMPRLEGFAVQVGAFRDERTLEQARAKLAAAGIPHYVERLDASGGGLTRLRAGPFPTREAAERARSTIRGAALDGQVVPLP